MSLLQKILVGRWIVGTTIDEAISKSISLSDIGINSMINYLGEDTYEKKTAEFSTNIYLQLIKKIKENNLNSSIAVKPTQLGLFINKETLEKNYLKIIKTARKNNIFVWLDMEKYTDVSNTISLYLKYNSIGNTGICLQSYLKRTNSDLIKIIKSNGVIRLVKGAYTESKSISYNRDDSTKNYINLMEYLFKKSNNFTLATHDLNIIRKSFALSKKYKKTPKYAMLYGIRNNLAKKISRNHDMSLYLPFGEEWINYSYRRLRESSNIKLVLRSLFENQKI